MVDDCDHTSTDTSSANGKMQVSNTTFRGDGGFESLRVPKKRYFTPALLKAGSQ